MEAFMALDEEIAAEGRMSESQELMLYNMSLRQTSQRAAGGREGTHVLLSNIEGDPAYREMIERGLVERRLYGRGGAGAPAAASLIVTQKGLRYCVLYASEIEPKRAYDVAGVQRAKAEFATRDEAPDVNYALLTSGMTLGGSPAKSAAVGLTDDQVERLEELGAERRERDILGRPPASPSMQGETATASDDDSVRITITPDMTFCGFSVDETTVTLSREQVEKLEELGEHRKSMRRIEREFQTGNVSERREYTSEDGVIWIYVVADGVGAQVVGLSSYSRMLRIPGEIEGIAVYAVGANALSQNETVEEIVCPDSIVSIGEGAFRLNPKLRKLVLPADVAEFKPSWVERCPNLAELVLPGMVEEVSRRMFENRSLRRVAIGRGTRRIEPGAFQDACLAEVSIDDDNPFIATDGDAIYTRDGLELLALARPVTALSVRDGCVRLARKCCCGFSEMAEVSFPESLAEIGPFAFSRTGLERFDAPPSLRIIDEKVFYGCTLLQSVALNDGLEVIGDSAFEGSSIAKLVIPASIKSLGASMTRGTHVVHSGPGCTLSIEEGCADLFLDGAGGLYRVREDGPHLMQVVDGDIDEYDVYDGAVAIDPHAFAFHENIRIVRVPASVRSIGRSAFRVCRNLRRVELPDTLKSIGDEAFLDTGLEEFRVPAALEELGSRALVTYGAHHGSRTPSLKSIEVAPGNEWFSMLSGMLCHKSDAGMSVVVFAGSQARVEFPDEVTRVEEYAFANARGIEYLSLNPRLSTIGTNGLSTWCWIRQIHVEVAEPVAGRHAFDFFFPDTPGAVRGISLGLGGASWVNVPGIAEQLDLCLVSARDYNAPGKTGNISAYAQAKLILDRLDDPVMLTAHNRMAMERVLRNNIEDICVDVALYDDRSVLDDLIERGFVNADNFERVIERVNTLRDASSTAYLLEAKRERLSGASFDYEL